MRRFVFSIITVIVVLGAAVPAHADRRQAVPRMPQTFHSYGVGFDNLGVVQIANLAIVDRQVDALRAIRFRFLAEQASWNGYYWGVQGPMGWMPITYGDGGWLPGIRPLTPGERVVGAAIAGATVGGIFGGRRGALIGGIAAGATSAFIERRTAREARRIAEAQAEAMAEQEREVREAAFRPNYRWVVKNTTRLVAQFVLDNRTYTVEPYGSVEVDRPDGGFSEVRFIQPVVGGLNKLSGQVVPTTEGTSWELVPTLK